MEKCVGDTANMVSDVSYIIVMTAQMIKTVCEYEGVAEEDVAYSDILCLNFVRC